MERIALMQALLPSAKSFDNAIHLSPELGFVYFSNPIVACSTMKATLNSATARALGLPQPGLRLEQIHDRAANPLKRPGDIGLPAFAAMLDDPAVRKISVIRDPLRRFMSCFGKKLTRENRITERLRDYLKIPAGATLNEALTPDGFIAALEADARLLNMNDHWRPQRRQVFYDLVPDLCLGRVEALAQDVDRLLTPIFGADGFELIDVSALSPQNSSRGRAVPALSAAGIEAVGRVYAGDAQMLAEVMRAAPAVPAAASAAPAVDQDPRVAMPVSVSPVIAPAAVAPWQPPVPDPARPQLIVHVGMTGTGTAAIAAALAAAGPQLAAHSTIDLGPSPLVQHKITLEAALPLPGDMLADLGAGWAERLASFASGAGAVRLIVSNAALGARPQAMAALLAPLHQRFDVRVVIFARDPHAWLPAVALAGAAGQQPLAVLLRQYRHLIDWLHLMPGAVEIHPCRAGSDMIAAAGAVFGIALPRPDEAGAGSDGGADHSDGDHSDTDHSDPAGAVVAAMLATRAGDGGVLPRLRRRVPTLEQSVRGVPSDAQVKAAIAENIGIFDAITEAGGPDLLALADAAPPMPAPEALRTRLLEVLASLTVDQAARIAGLEARVAALEVQPPPRPGRKA